MVPENSQYWSSGGTEPRYQFRLSKWPLSYARVQSSKRPLSYARVQAKQTITELCQKLFCLFCNRFFLSPRLAWTLYFPVSISRIKARVYNLVSLAFQSSKWLWEQQNGPPGKGAWHQACWWKCDPWNLHSEETTSFFSSCLFPLFFKK